MSFGADFNKSLTQLNTEVETSLYLWKNLQKLKMKHRKMLLCHEIELRCFNYNNICYAPKLNVLCALNQLNNILHL